MQRCNNTTLVFLAHMCWRETRRICRIRMRQIGLLVRWAGRRPRRCFKVKLRGHSWSVRAANRDATRALLCEYHILKSSIWRTDQLWDDYCAWRNPMALIYVIFFFLFLFITAWMKKWSIVWSTAHHTDTALLSPTTSTAHWETLSCTIACTP